MNATMIRLTHTEVETLERCTRSRTVRAGSARKARLILMLARDDSYSRIQAALGCSANYIVLWKRRFLSDRLDGLRPRHRGSQPRVLTPRLEARILSWTRRTPPDGSTHWSTRKLARQLGINHMMVARVWARARLKPHRLERYLRSNDPDFETK